METKNLNNQNPEAAELKQDQEEKPQTVDQPTTKNINTRIVISGSEMVVMPQLTETDKITISKYISSQVLKSYVKANTREKKSVVSPQINELLHYRILDLLKDMAKSTSPGTSGFHPDKIGQREISDVDRNLILVLIRDPNKAETKELKAPLISEDIDYDHLNKQELVNLLEDIVQEKDVTKIKDQVAQIKGAFYRRNKEDIDNRRQDFIAAGGNEATFDPTSDPLEIRFQNAFNIYRHNKAKYSEELEHLKQLNLQEKYRILEDLKTLVNSEETLKKTYDEFQNLQEQWKQVGMVPASELNDLWQNYHFLVEKFFDKVRINKELRDLDLKKNMEKKIELCEKAEDLLNEDSVIKSFKLLQKYHEEWREVGPVPRDKNEEIWERFKTATEKINQRRREHYKELQDIQKLNFEAKEALCEQADLMVSELECITVSEWEGASEKLGELMKLWKTIGRAPKNQNDEVWKKFKTSLDKFYTDKREFFGELKKHQIDNYNLKLKLCERAEALKDNDSWRITTDELINLQKEWKKIGPAPRKYSDKIWKQFRAACDTFFERKAEFYKERRNEEEDNLKKKLAIIESVKAFEPRTTQGESIAALKDFQKQWQEIGHVVFKEKDKIYKQFKDAYNDLVSRLDINPSDLNSTNFVNKLEMYKNAIDGKQHILKERLFLSSKLKKLQDDIILWENNIGFFSNSKQSIAFKTEFEKKIDSAKKGLASIQEKIKLIDKELQS